MLEAEFDYLGVAHFNPGTDANLVCDGCDIQFQPWQHYIVYGLAERAVFRVAYSCQDRFFRRMLSQPREDLP